MLQWQIQLTVFNNDFSSMSAQSRKFAVSIQPFQVVFLAAQQHLEFIFK